MIKTYIILIVLIVLVGGIFLAREVHRGIIKHEYNECQAWLKESREIEGYAWANWQKEQCEQVAGFVFNK